MRDLFYIFNLIDMLDYIDTHLHENISVQEISRNAGFSYWHGNRLFQTYFGESLAAYLRRVRIEAAKEALLEFKSVKQAAQFLAYESPDVFSRIFHKHFGITPSAFLRGEKLKEHYVKTYEYRNAQKFWGTGENPCANGLWEFGYYDTTKKSYALMEWDAKEEYFIAPFASPDVSDPYWYCRNRWRGYGMHPGKTAQAVRTFVCPHSGEMEFFISVGRFAKLHPKSAPCTVQIFHDDEPISPTKEPMVLEDFGAVFLTGSCHVNRGDRIRFHLDSAGNISHQGLIVYRQRFGYTKISAPEE